MSELDASAGTRMPHQLFPNQTSVPPVWKNFFEQKDTGQAWEYFRRNLTTSEVQEMRNGSWITLYMEDPIQEGMMTNEGYGLG